MALQPIGEDVWAAHYPHVFAGLHIGTRMTVVRLLDGTLLVYSPIRLDDALRREIDVLGTVTHIVAPNLFHHVYFGEFAVAFPEAKTHAAAGLEKKRDDLGFDAILDDVGDPAWHGELVPVVIEGLALGETVLFHPRSRTLVSADFIQNFDSSSHWPTRLYLRVAGIHGRAGVSRPIRIMFRDKAKARRSIDRVLELDPERVTLAHGRPILEDGAQTIREAYRWLKP